MLEQFPTASHSYVDPFPSFLPLQPLHFNWRVTTCATVLHRARTLQRRNHFLDTNIDFLFSDSTQDDPVLPHHHGHQNKNLGLFPLFYL